MPQLESTSALFTPSGVSVAILNSIRIRKSASAYISRTFGAPTNNTVWAMSFWGKLGAFDAAIKGFFSTGAVPGAGNASLTWHSDYTIHLNNNAGTNVASSTAVLRDPSAHGHFYMQSTGTAINVYFNNQLYLTYAGTITNINSAIQHNIGVYYTYYADMVQSQWCFVDGQSLSPASFAAADPVSGEWKPITSEQIRTNVGTWGNNGCMLLFNGTPGATIYDRKVSDTDTAGNNWTATNISTTAGVTYDWLIDSPSNATSGIQPVGNYGVWDILNLATTAALTASNLNAGASGIAICDTRMDTGVIFYWEITSTGGTTNVGVYNGVASATYGVTTGSTIGFRFNATTGALDWTNNGTSWTSIATGLTTGPYFIYASTAAATTASLNCGQRPFSYSPTGVVSVCTANLPSTVVITSGSFTGNANANGPEIDLNGAPITMTINGNAVTWGTHADKLAHGFKIRTASASYNTAGANTFSVTSAGKAFKYANAQGNP